MIVAKLRGRLGNQMFQYAVARALAARVETETKLDASWIEHPEGSDGRRYELRPFALDVDLAHVRTFARLPVARRVLRPLQRALPRRRPFLRVIREPNTFAFVPQVVTAGDGVYLDGFWQSEDYFADQAALIRRELNIPRPVRESAVGLAEDIERETSVSMHVRRGDYLTAKVSSLLTPLPIDYYLRGLDVVVGKVGPCRTFVFSDDPDWCEQQLRLDDSAVIVRNDGQSAPLEDLYLMSRCNHHIIANSSFSWWGAWLDPSPEKVVVAPRRWFNDPALASAPRVPRNWVAI